MVLNIVCIPCQNDDAENIGYIIPPPVIRHFISDFERNGRYTAFPALGIEWQKMESPFLRKALGMSVRSRSPRHSAWNLSSTWPNRRWRAPYAP